MRTVKHLLCLLVIVLPSIAAAQVYEWGENMEVPGLTTRTGVIGAAFHDGVLHVMSTDRNRQVHHARFVDGQWTSPVVLAYHRSGMAPDLAVCNGRLHMIGRPPTFKIWHSVWENGAWQNPEDIVAMETRSRATLTAFDGVLHLSHRGMNTERARVFHAANAGWGWGHNVALPDQHARAAGAMAGLDGTLHMVYVAKNSKTAWHTSLTRWGEWTPPAQIPGADPERGVDLVKANGKLFLVYGTTDKGAGGQMPIAYCEYADGQWTAPTIIDGFVCYGSPAAAVEPGLPQRIHLLLPTGNGGVLYLRSIPGEVKAAPLKMKKMKLGQ